MLSWVLDFVFPPKCALCDRIGREAICEECRGEFKGAEEPRLRVSSEALSEIAMVFAFEGRAAQAVKRLKYERATALGKPMAEILASEVARRGWDQLDAAVPVPISARRFRERGFNQAEVLAEGLPEGYVKKEWMKRIRHTRPQVGLKAEERVRNLEGAFWASSDVAGKAVLLIDDVSTTGGTAVACAEALATAGATRVVMLTFCGESV